MHGQSAYTPTKQMQLKSLLTACFYAWEKSHSFASRGRYFIDCMAGSGYDDKGEPGSPLILQEYAKRFVAGRCAWCDVEKKFTTLLAGYADPRYTSIFTGRYQDVVPIYLRNNVPPNAMGLVYLDDNGCKEVWNDDGFLRNVMSDYPMMDVAIHFSEHTWLRCERAEIDWAQRKSVMDVLQFVLDAKPQSVVYAPRVRHHWRLVYGCRSEKMNLTGQKRIRLSDYIEGRAEKQMALLEVP